MPMTYPSPYPRSQSRSRSRSRAGSSRYEYKQFRDSRDSRERTAPPKKEKKKGRFHGPFGLYSHLVALGFAAAVTVVEVW